MLKDLRVKKINVELRTYGLRCSRVFMRPVGHLLDIDLTFLRRRLA